MQALLMIIQLLPAIIRVVTEIEAIAPQTGLGSAKMDLILQGVRIAYDELSGSLKGAPAFDKVQSFIQKYASYVVKVFNDIGFFQKGTPAPAQPAAPKP
jgi:hypothetical protein